MSISANELRIGNYADFEGKIVYITSINHLKEVKEWYLEGWSDELNQRFGINFFDANPIPLTPEWLERFGFRKNRKFFAPPINEEYEEYSLNGYVFMEDINGYYFLSGYNWNTEHLKYVHQLQNLVFALSGEELTLQK
jgi:hypothetical protein